MKENNDLDRLRGREDFKKLLTALEAEQEQTSKGTKNPS
jgi:hypothetical protein